jgi:hypothetical protein
MAGRGQGRKIVRSRFRAEEDARLRVLVSQLGTEAWTEIAGQMPGRNIRQCRDRWTHYLADMPVTAAWTVTDDTLLRRMLAAVGPRCEHLALLFPDWMANDAHRRWAAAGIPCAEFQPAADFPGMGEMQTQMDDWSGDTFFPRDSDKDLRDGSWLTPMDEARKLDFL